MSSRFFRSFMYAQMDERLRVEADSRLVEEQNVRRVQQTSGDLEPPLHTAGKCADQAVLAVPQADHIEHLAHPGCDGGGWDGIESGMEPEVLFGREVSVEGGVLEHEPDHAPDLVLLSAES